MWTIQREAPAIRSFALGRGLHINALPTYPNHNHNISLVPISARAEYRTGGLSMLDIICVYHMQISRHQTASRTRSEPAPLRHPWDGCAANDAAGNVGGRDLGASIVRSRCWMRPQHQLGTELRMLVFSGAGKL